MAETLTLLDATKPGVAGADLSVSLLNYTNGFCRAYGGWIKATMPMNAERVTESITEQKW